MAPGAIGSPGRAVDDGPRAARAVRLPAPRGGRRGLGARRPLRPSRRRRRGHRAGRRLGVRPRRAPRASSRRASPPSSSTSRCGWPPSTARRRRARSRCCCRPRARARRPRCGRGRPSHPTPQERLNERQRALLASLPRFAGGDLAALRRLEGRGLVSISPRIVRRAPLHVPVGAARAQPELTADQAAALRGDRDGRRPASGCCCTASPARARPRSTCGRPRRCSPPAAG